MAQAVFERIEKKYMLTTAQHQALTEAFVGRLAQDAYGLHTISNLYMDTDDFALIRASIDKPVYKEKLRLRAYGTPKAEDTVFLELKKKFKGIVYKRRAQLTEAEAMDWLLDDVHPEADGQILQEIDWFMRRYNVSPKAFIAYDRVALAGVEDSSIRVTFDDNIRWRGTQLDLTKGSWGMPLLPQGQMIMEVKVSGAMPIWLAHAFSELDIMPTSYSKYGACYKQHLHDQCAQGGIADVS